MLRTYSLVGFGLCLFALPGCGVFYSYHHRDTKLDVDLAIPMTATHVQDTLGAPRRVVQRDQGRLLVWEYRLYPHTHWIKELVACPFTAWLGGCLFYPAIGIRDPDYPPPYYLVLYDGHLCTWGTLEQVSASTTCRDARPPLTPSP